MKNNKAEVLDKLVEIAKLKMELVELVVPEKTFKHLEVIGNEIKAMLLETESKPNESSVKKVDIE